jgi:hypothetical protein
MCKTSFRVVAAIYLTRPRLLYDGLGYFFALTGTFLRWVGSLLPTTPCTAVNVMNAVLYRPSCHAYRSTGYILLRVVQVVAVNLTKCTV